MTVSLHSAVVGTYQQMLPQVAHIVNKVEQHCSETGVSFDDLAKGCLAPDMWPFAKQIQQCGHHSARAIEAVRVGLFTPQPGSVEADIGTMRKEIDDALKTVNAVDPDELDAIAERDMLFKVGKFDMTFTVADFLLSFSLPNFYFHTSTAYNIARMSGVQLGKADFLGKMRQKP